MYDTSFTPPPVGEKPKHSPLGIASFVASLVALLTMCGFFAFSYIIGSQGATNSQSMGIVAWVFICTLGLSTLAGIGLGIAAVVQKGTNKVFGILGLVFSSLLLLGFCLLMLFGVGIIALVGLSYPGLQGIQGIP
jgi:hypothetical protein